MDRVKINPKAAGWVIGLTGVGIGIFGIGIPLRIVLLERGMSPTFANTGVIFGAIVGLGLVLVGIWLLDRYTRSESVDRMDRPSELFKDDETNEEHKP